MEEFARPIRRPAGMPAVSSFVDFPEPADEGDSLFERRRPAPTEASLPGSSSSSSSRRSERRPRSNASGTFDYRVTSDPYLAPALAISTAVDAAARQLIDETAHLLSGPGQSQAVEQIIRQVAPGILTEPEAQLRFQEINLLRQYIDELGRMAEETPLAMFVNMVAARASAYATEDLLIQQPASRRLGVSRITSPSPAVPTRELLESLNLGVGVRDLQTRLRARETALRDRILDDLTTAPSEVTFATPRGVVSSGPETPVSDAARAAFANGANPFELTAEVARSATQEAAEVFRDLSALRSVSPQFRARTDQPRLDPRDLVRLNSVTASPAQLTQQDVADASDVTTQAVRLLRAASEEIRTNPLEGTTQEQAEALAEKMMEVVEKLNGKAVYLRTMADPDAVDSPFNTDQAARLAQAGNARSNININVDAGVIDAQQLQGLLEDTRLERQQEIETALMEQIRSANNADREQEKQRTKYLSAIVDLLSNPVLTGQERPSSKLLGAMGLAMSRIVSVNPTFAPIATRRNYELLYANRDGIVTARFAEAVASILLESGSFSRYQSQMATSTSRGLGTDAYTWFQLRVYYDKQRRRVVIVPDGETTETMGIVGWEKPRRRPTIADRLSGLRRRIARRPAEILVREIESVPQQPSPRLIPIPPTSFPSMLGRRR